MKLHLVCTSDEALWPKPDVPILFLGDWCLLESRRAVWETYDYRVVSHHWNDRLKFHSDIEASYLIYEEMLTYFSQKLNIYHGIKKSREYWRIIIGPWLLYMIQILLDRWEVVSTALVEHEISDYRMPLFDEQKVVPSCMDDFVKRLIGHDSEFVSDHWHQYIFGHVLSWHGVTGKLLAISSDDFSESKITIPKNRFSQLKKLVIELLVKSVRKFTKHDEVFIIASYLSTKMEIFLQLRLGQLPKFWRRVSITPCAASISDRNLESEREVKDRSFNTFLKYMLIKQMPTAYKEGYSTCLNQILDQNWPDNPKLIYTANSYNSDDIFKIWMADKSEHGAPIMIAQHGGSYGVAKEAFMERHQLKISNKYISWGWTAHGKDHILPLGIIKTMGKKIDYDQKGNLTLIHMAVTRLPYHVWSGINGMSQWKQYAEQQYLFVSRLPDSIKNKVTVRLLAADFGVDQKARWPKELDGIEFDDGFQSLFDRFEKSRLIVATYNATTFLESMSLDIPTIIFWDPSHYEIREDSEPFFGLLRSVGIFHDSADSAADFVSSIWNDVEGWWRTPSVQHAKEQFCNQYCRVPLKPLAELFEVFNDVAITQSPKEKVGRYD